MRIKKKNVARLASLSALGAGVLGVAAGTAQAGIVYSGPLNATVGFRSGDNTLFSGAGFVYRAGGSWTSGSVHGARKDIVFAFPPHLIGPGFGTAKATNNGWLMIFPKSAVWNTATHQSRRSGIVGARTWSWRSCRGCGWTTRHRATPSAFQHQFVLFELTGPSFPMYGWMELSLDVTNAFGPDFGGTLGPNVTVEGWAYDDSGNLLPAGDTGNTVPEPSTLALTGLAALAFGATGLRRWRAARKPAA
jgi:hypothetical protein